MPKIVFLRHGESEWNVANIFTGWHDVDLSPAGKLEAVQAGQCLKEKGFKFDIVFTSVLKRSIKTAWTCLMEADNCTAPVVSHWRLNERHYGGLQGLNKADTAAKYGEDQVKIWRRSYDIPPPSIDKSDMRHPCNDPLYRSVPKDALPGAESLALTVDRVLPYWNDNIAPCVKAGKSVLVAAHGNSLRAICKYLKGMSEKEVLDFNIPTAVPLVYELDDDLRFVRDYYLMDEAELKQKMEAVAAQGRPKPAAGITFLICGGGNGAHAFAGVAAHRGANVHIYTQPHEVEKWNAGGLSMTCHYPDGTSITAKPKLVTCDPKAAAAGVDIALVCLPTFLHEAQLCAVGPHLPEGAKIGTIEGAWWGRPPIPGADWLKKLTFYGIRTLPWAARLKDYGKSVDILGTKNAVEVASSPMNHVGAVSEMLERTIGSLKFPCSANLLGLFAIDAGQIIHPGVMYGRLSDWDGTPFDEAPLFYQGIDERSEEVMMAMDAEIIALRDEIQRRFPQLDLKDCIPTLQWLHGAYTDQIADKSSFRLSFNTNSAYKGLRFPMKPAPDHPGKLVPLFDYRYLTADVPYGIVVIKGIAEVFGFPTPMLDRVITWAQGHLGKEFIVGDKLTGKDLAETRAPQKFGITTLDQFMDSALA